MAYEGDLKILPGTHNADADLSAKQFYAVKATNTSGGGVALAGLGEAVLGVLQNKPAQYNSCEVAYAGITKVVAGAGFNRGVLLKSDANGKFITATAGSYIAGIALETSGGDGNIVSALLFTSRLEV